MKVLLLQDVYKLGRAGDVKKVANGYGRNFLIPQGFAVLATPGALKDSERIRETANKQRTILNEEMSGVAESMVGVQLQFPARAGETGKLYGSVTTQMLADALTKKLSVEITKRQIASQPLRLLGMHTVKIRLTLDLVPEISAVIYREGEPVENYMVPAEELASQAEEEFPEEEDVIEAPERTSRAKAKIAERQAKKAAAEVDAEKAELEEAEAEDESGDDSGEIEETEEDEPSSDSEETQETEEDEAEESEEAEE